MIKIAKTKSSDVCIYEFGVRVDKECVKAVDEQIRKARALYNNLVAVIQAIVTEQNAFILDLAGNEAKTLNIEIDRLTEQFLAARANQDEVAMKQIARERHQKRLGLWQILALSRKENKRDIQVRFLNRIGKSLETDTYKARVAAVEDGLGWATANEILDNALDAFKKTMAKGLAPRFARGLEKVQDTLTLQFTQAGGLPLDKFTTTPSGGLFIGQPVNGKYGEFRFRLGSDKADVWATGTWNKSRDIPEGASIGLARLVRRKVGKDFKYCVQLQVKINSNEVGFLPKKPLVAIHLGWAKDGDTRNLAGIADCADPSVVEILRLPESVERLLNQSSVAQSRRDVALNAVVPMVRVWEADWIPEDIRDELQVIRKLRPEYVAESRLHRLCWMIKNAGLEVPGWLEAWRKQDKMDWQEASHVARRARNQRKNFYRETAKRLAAAYATVVIEKPDLKDAAELVDEVTGEKTEMAKKARAGRVVAGLYDLDLSLRHAFEKAGGAILELSGETTASQCSICGGNVEGVTDTPDAVVCHECGAVFNRKQNGAANAWQMTNDVANDMTVEYHIEARKAIEEKRQKQREKLEKMAEKRRQNQTEKQKNQSAA